MGIRSITLTLWLFAVAAGLLAAQPSDPARTARLSRTFLGPSDRDGALPYPLDLAAMGITLPRIADDVRAGRMIHDQRTVYYKLGQTWQHWIPPSRTEHRNETFGSSTFTTTAQTWGVFRASYLADFNANKDFPWETTLGLNLTHRAKSPLYSTINLLALPEDEAGHLLPVLLLVDDRPVRWVFPTGTVFGEIITVAQDGRRWVQEIRLRTKSDDSSKWFPAVFRPVRNREEFQRLTGLRYEPGRRYLQLRNPEEDEVFELHGTLERLPSVDATVTRALLSRPFVNVTRENWHPAPDQDFAILPRDYTLGLLTTVDSQVCGSCHRQTQISVRNLIPRDPSIIANPSKVGNIRGCDGIFTWHPFDARSVRADDTTPAGRAVLTRAFDARNGIVRTFRRGDTPPPGYKITEYVQTSLRGYELPDPVFLHPAKSVFPEPPMALPLVPDGIQVVPAPDGAALPVSAQQPASGLRWEFRGELDPARYYRGVLRQGQRIVGVWDSSVRAFRPVDAAGRFGAPATSPLPVPESIRREQ